VGAHKSEDQDGQDYLENLTKSKAELTLFCAAILSFFLQYIFLITICVCFMILQYSELVYLRLYGKRYLNKKKMLVVDER
jgi:hypothetical protein